MGIECFLWNPVFGPTPYGMQNSYNEHPPKPYEDVRSKEYAMDEHCASIRLTNKLDAKNAHVVEAHINEMLDQTQATAIVLDMEGLESISSAGLHVVMRLIKRLGRVSIVEANDEVYATLEMTGITKRALVRRRPPELSVEDCELVGRGVTAAVYRLDDDTIAKVSNANIPRKTVEDEYNRARAAFMIGVPTAVAYQTVRVGDCFGTVFEMLEGQQLLDVMAQDKDHLVDWVTKYANVVREIHAIEINPLEFDDIHARTIERISRLAGHIATQEEKASFANLYRMLPERHTFLHGDCHPGNVIVRDGELVLIDLADGGMGHPIIDLLSMCLSYKYMTMYGPEFYGEQRQIIGVIRPFGYDEARLIWSTFLHVYFDTDDEQFLSKAEGQILAFGALKLILGTLDAPDYLAEDTLQSLKRIVLDFAARLEPVCF